MSTEDIRLDIGKASDWVYNEAEQILGEYTHPQFRRMVDAFVKDAAGFYNVSPESVKHELVRRHAEALVRSLPRKVAKRC